MRARSAAAAAASADDETSAAVAPARPAAGGVDALPWLAEPLAQTLRTQRGHALLVHADAGVGALEFALAYAHGLLCEAADADARKPCGRIR